MQGPIRAMGLQNKASYWAIGTYYLIGIPISCILAIWKDYGVLGLQLGIAAAVTVQFFAYAFILRTNNWQDVADKAVARIKQEEVELAEKAVL